MIFPFKRKPQAQASQIHIPASHSPSDRREGLYIGEGAGCVLIGLYSDMAAMNEALLLTLATISPQTTIWHTIER